MDPVPQKVEQSTGRALVVVKEITENLSEEQRTELYRWAHQVMAVRTSSAGKAKKAVAAVRLSAKREVLGPILYQLQGQLKKAGVRSKRLLWDDRNWASRMALGGAAAAVAVAGAEGAGVAALGSAVGVPLWLLTASGGAFFGTLIEELKHLVPEGERIEPEEVDWAEIDRLLAKDLEDA